MSDVGAGYKSLLKGAAVAALMTTGSAAYADCGEVTITEMNWPRLLSSQLLQSS